MEHEQIFRVLGDFVVNSDRVSMTEERKTLEQREQMTDLERLRHSASHVLATAILKIWPEAQFAAGPPVENGFYYDVDLRTAFHLTISRKSRRR
jgi:threonyl-tRNA synthetase